MLIALGTLIVQIAEQDSKYNEQIAKELKKISVNDDRSPNIFKKKVGKLDDLKSEGDLAVLWKEFILEKFTRASDGTSRTLYLLLDGLDQFDYKERDELLAIFIDKRYQSSPALRNFSEKTKKSAKETLIDKAKGRHRISEKIRGSRHANPD